MLQRDRCLKFLAEKVTDELVVCTIGMLGTEWQYYSAGRPAMFDSGAMGLASSLGLGVALALPNRKVLVFDGDGALLMSLGSLATLAQQNPANLVHLVFQNSVYESCAGGPVVDADKVDFAQMARAAGIERSYNIEEEEDFKAKVDEFLKTPGLTFAALKVSPAERVVAVKGKNYLENKRRFMEFIRQDNI
jgi:thiamine pyrophosphate-dependent acetolactate synthase large subunit-like protein